MNDRIDKDQETLLEYKEQFEKTKKTLQQDHDTYVKIKEDNEKSLHDQMAIQQATELQVTDALQQKIDLKLKEYQNHTALAAVQQQEIIDQQNAAKAKLEAEQ